MRGGAGAGGDDGATGSEADGSDDGGRGGGVDSCVAPRDALRRLTSLSAWTGPVRDTSLRPALKWSLITSCCWQSRFFQEFHIPMAVPLSGCCRRQSFPTSEQVSSHLQNQLWPHLTSLQVLRHPHRMTHSESSTLTGLVLYLRWMTELYSDTAFPLLSCCHSYFVPTFAPHFSYESHLAHQRQWNVR
jgi:hypothetical protein